MCRNGYSVANDLVKFSFRFGEFVWIEEVQEEIIFLI